jgi:hypothetical protein
MAYEAAQRPLQRPIGRFEGAEREAGRLPVGPDDQDPGRLVGHGDDHRIQGDLHVG